MFLKTLLFEDSSIFTKAPEVKSLKLYSSQINPLLIAKGFDPSIDDPDAIKDVMKDGAFIGKIIEKTVLEHLKKIGVNASGLGKNAPYDIRYILNDIEKEIKKEGNIEVRVIGKTGINLAPSSTKGSGRVSSPEKTKEKIGGSDYYILVDIREINEEGGTYSVYLVISTYLEKLYKGGHLGKYGSSKSAKIIDQILSGKLEPDTEESLMELISNIDIELKNNDLGLNKRQIQQLISLKNQYNKSLERIRNINSINRLPVEETLSLFECLYRL